MSQRDIDTRVGVDEQHALSRWRTARMRRSRTAAHRASLFAFIAGIINLASAALPAERGRLDAVSTFFPGGAVSTATIVSVAAGLGLLLLSGGLRRRSRIAWIVTVALLLGSCIAHYVKGLDIEEAVIEAFFAGYLAGKRRDFTARTTSRQHFSVLWPGLVVLIATFLYAMVGLTVPQIATGDSALGAGERIMATWQMAIGAGLDADIAHRFGRYFAPSVAVMFYLGVTFVIWRALRPIVVARSEYVPISSAQARASSDSLAWFATRDDRYVVRSDEQAVAYGSFGSVALAAGDPFGDPEHWEKAIEAFLSHARRCGQVPAVMGCGERAAAGYRDAGMIVVYMGDEAVLDLQNFTLDGGARKIARQSWNRAKRAGFTATLHRARDLTPEEVVKLNALSVSWRGDAAERGYSMTLGRLFDSRDGDAVFAIARNETGDPVGFIHFVPWGVDGVSLDVMRRAATAPAILNDFLIVECARGLPALGVTRMSLNFSFLRAVVADELETKSVVVMRWLLRRLSRRFQIESLYRFNKKFDPVWQPRYFALETAEDAPRVMFTALRAEGLIS